MRKVKTIQKVIKSELCISCGTCAGFYNDFIEMGYDSKRSIPSPKIKKKNDGLNNKKLIGICPGKGYSINKLSKDIDGGKNKLSFESASYIEKFAATCNNNSILKRNR